MNAIETDMETADGLRVYDLSPNAPSLWAVAGPGGVDPATIDSDNLPNGFRWVEDGEWAQLCESSARSDDSVDLGEENQSKHSALRAAWGMCDSPIFLVIDERGINLESGCVRHLAGDVFIYCDDVDGFKLLTRAEVETYRLRSR